MLVDRIQVHLRRTQSEDSRTSHQGDIVKVDYVEVAAENATQLPRLQPGLARLLCDERRKPSQPAAQAMHHNSVGVFAGDRRSLLLQAIGVFAVDDFGVGFSSIGYLQQLPVEVLKTDRSFSMAIDTDERACGLLRSMVSMGKALGLDVLVEGVERESQIVHLLDHVGATHAQGYLLHQPMTLTNLAATLVRAPTVV